MAGKAYIVTKKGCWEWHRPTNSEGYGPHKAIYEFHKGPVEPLMMLHHICENRLCVNPDHLEPLSVADHMRAHGKRILSPSDKVVIWASTKSNRELAEEYGVTFQTIWKLRGGKQFTRKLKQLQG